MPLSERPYAPTPGGATVANQTALNQQAALISGPLPATQTITGTAETIIANPENLLTALLAILPGQKYPFEQTLFDYYESGKITTSVNATVTLRLYSGSSLTPGSNTLLGSSGAITQNATTESYFIHARLMFNSVTTGQAGSGTLSGTVEFYLNRTKVAEVTLSNFVTGLSEQNNPILSLCTSAQFSAAGTNIINTQRKSVG